MRPPSRSLPIVGTRSFRCFKGLVSDQSSRTVDLRRTGRHGVVGLLLQVGDKAPRVQQRSVQRVARGTHSFKTTTLLSRVLPVLVSPSLRSRRHRLLMGIVSQVLFGLNSLIEPCIRGVLIIVRPLLVRRSCCAHVRKHRVVAGLSGTTKLTAVVTALQPSVSRTSRCIHGAATHAFTIITSTLKVRSLIPFLQTIYHDGGS